MNSCDTMHFIHVHKIGVAFQKFRALNFMNKPKTPREKVSGVINGNAIYEKKNQIGLTFFVLPSGNAGNFPRFKTKNK